ncbi:MAG: ADOP family duplicated permease [Bryobacteraceae bacterium]
MTKLGKKLRALWRRRQLDRDLDDELQFHLAMKAEEAGSPWERRRRLGNPTALKERCRELWSFAFLESWWQDFRYALRTLGRSPGFTLIAVVALALGIGANTTVFTVVSSALSFDLGVDRVDRIVLISATDASRRDAFAQSLPFFRDFTSQVHSITNLAAYGFAPVNLSDKSGLPERYFCVRMTASGFAVMGRKPALGRLFKAEDQAPDAPGTLILSYRVWQNRYGKDRSILGRTVRVDEVPRTVVGVMPLGMQFPEDADVWMPLTAIDLARPEGRNLLLFGRLADGVKLAAARSEIDTIAKRLASKSPESYKGLAADVQPILDIYGVYNSRPLFIAVFFAVGFVLLIACGDVANMLLARAAARSREISIRIAIGAGRSRIIRQLLVESVILSTLGGVFGLVIAFAGLHWFDGVTAAAPRPAWVDFSLNTRAFVYLAAVSIGTGILFGLAPALQLAKLDVNSAVKNGGHSAAGGLHGRRLSSLLVVIEMALCVVLLAAAGLMIRSSVNLYSTPIGVNAANVLTMHINLPEAKYPLPRDEAAFHRRLKTKLESLPGVEVASVASHLPGSGWMSFPFEVEGSNPPGPGHLPSLGALVVEADYFRVMQVRAQRGCLFTGSDEVAGSSAVMVNESFAARIWPGEDPTGKRLRLVTTRAPQPWRTVVGVVPDIRQNFRRPLERDALIYLPYAADPQRVVFLISRTRVPPGTLAEPFRAAIQSLDENLPVFDVRTLEDRIAQNRLNVSAFGALFTLFATVALVLASVGLYAVIAHAVSRRTQEIGIRMAMGGSRRDILALVFAQGMRPVAIGLAAGLLVSLGVTRVLRMALVGVSPNDPVTFLSVVLVLLVASLLGCAVPARRAIRVDPVIALRYE